MRVLLVGQNSQVSKAISAGRHLVEKGRLVWADNGQDVTYPISLYEVRQRRFIPPVYSYEHTFDDLCQMFPSVVVEMSDDDYLRGYPSWGTGWYTKNEQGFAECLKENWDSSD